MLISEIVIECLFSIRLLIAFKSSFSNNISFSICVVANPRAEFMGQPYSLIQYDLNLESVSATQRGPKSWYCKYSFNSQQVSGAGDIKLLQE